MLEGANPNRRDSGRSLCAEEWARFCGCHNCADAIAKYIRSKKYFFKKTFFQLSKEKWTSEPDLLAGKSSAEKSRGGGGGGGSSWIQRHLSLKRKKSTRPGEVLTIRHRRLTVWNSLEDWSIDAAEERKCSLETLSQSLNTFLRK